jgi:DNA-directed RNA polymerase subunit L/DNA-directed RNA polymerase alpha subunit
MFHDYTESGPELLTNKAHRIRASFRIAPSNYTVANALRRQILVGTPSVGFRTEPTEVSEVQILTNTTPLVNEMISHRIGMIPIAADPLTFDPKRYEFTIDMENTSKEIVSVHASDFVIVERDPENPLDEGRVVPSELFFPPDPITKETCLITRLRPQWNPTAPHEKLVIRAKASVSTGKENIRWSPVSQCAYAYTLDDNEDRQTEMFHNWIKVSKKVENPSDLSRNRYDELRREYDTMEKQRCYRVDESGEPNDFTFHIESVGVLSAPQCVQAGIQSLIDLLAKYQDLDAELPENVSLRHANAQFPCVEFLFQEESHTLGTLLQHYLVENHIDGSEEPKINYAGYNPGHPLRTEMLLKVGVSESIEDPEMELQTARLVVAKTCRHIKSLFQNMLDEWGTYITTGASSTQ